MRTPRLRVVLVGLIVGPFVAAGLQPAAVDLLAAANGMRDCTLDLKVAGGHDDLQKSADRVQQALGSQGVDAGHGRARRAVSVVVGDPTRTFPPQPHTVARAQMLTMRITVASGWSDDPPDPQLLDAVLLHEVGHLAGLGHGDGGVMAARLSADAVVDYAAQVADAMGCTRTTAGPVGLPSSAVGRAVR